MLTLLAIAAAVARAAAEGMLTAAISTAATAPPLPAMQSSTAKAVLNMLTVAGAIAVSPAANARAASAVASPAASSLSAPIWQSHQC